LPARPRGLWLKLVPTITVEIVYARVDRQQLLTLTLASGSTIAEAIAASPILKQFPELQLADVKVGVFGQRCTLATVLHDGDRIEIYRPLIADPKQARRQRAKQQ